MLEGLLTFMSDCSPASLKLATTILKRHVLCFQHFRQHLSDAVSSFSFEQKNEFWQLVMKVLKWRGYSSDDALVEGIAELQRIHGPRNVRVRQVLADLMRHRVALCAFHVTKVLTMLRIASSAAEATHSSLKGAGEFRRLLRASNFFETLQHIIQAMKIYIDDTVTDIRQALAKGYTYSKYVHGFVTAA